ncbi:hypothetical protein [Antrihabitans stalagmiti]|nr:hypothetical protein [Antrihabitans stalagmiti]
MRIFHPATDVDGGPVRWADVARANGTTAHSVMEWGSIVGSWSKTEQAGLWHESPEEGSLPLPTLHALVDILRQFTQTPDSCYFAHWEGSGRVNELTDPPRLTMPGRGLIVFEGTLAMADVQFGSSPTFPIGMSPHLWWPDDRAWCVATDIDLMTTYLGASGDCVDAVLASTDVEALRASVDQQVTWNGDTINPLPPYRR